MVGYSLNSAPADARHGVPASAKGGLPSELVAAYRAFPNSEPFYSRALNRLAEVSAAAQCEQAVTELMLRWLPLAASAGLGGSAFVNSQFDFASFEKRLAGLADGLGCVCRGFPDDAG